MVSNACHAGSCLSCATSGQFTTAGTAAPGNKGPVMASSILLMKPSNPQLGLRGCSEREVCLIPASLSETSGERLVGSPSQPEVSMVPAPSEGQSRKHKEVHQRDGCGMETELCPEPSTAGA